MLDKLMLFASIILLVAACAPSGAPLSFSATLPQTVVRTSSSNVTLVPTLNRQPTRTPTDVPTDTAIPGPTDVPTETSSPTPNITPIPISSATPNEATQDVNSTPVPTWTPPPDDPATRLEDHLMMGRPISGDYTNYVDRSYPYGATQGGQFQTHHGVEFYNIRDIPVLAVADGTVFYAGDDLEIQFGSMLNYYGKLVVIQHDFTAPDGQPVFSLYGHLGSWSVETGMRVGTGDQIGLVGDTGIAQGPHLHFEVRVGDPHSFDATRNPEVWLRPFRGFGTLVGRVTDASGNLLYEATVQVRSREVSRNAFTYADDTVNSDPVFGENFTLGDIPANYYDVSVTDNGRVRFRRMIYIYPNRTTWIDIQLSN